MKASDVKIQTCDICNRHAITVKTRLIKPQNIRTSHHAFVDCEENTKMACFSCRAKIKNKKFFHELMIVEYKKNGIDYLHKMQDIALACSDRRVLGILFKLEEDIRKLEINKDNYGKQLTKKVYDK
jgi:hypothetical protein